MLIGCCSGVNLLDLHDVLLDFFEVCVFELSVLVKIRALLAVSKNKCGDLFKVEVLVTCEREYFVVVEVVHDYEHF